MDEPTFVLSPGTFGFIEKSFPTSAMRWPRK